MNPKLRMTLMAATIASLLAGPAWAASDGAGDALETPQAAPEQPRPEPAATPGMGRGPGEGPATNEGRRVGPVETPPIGEGRRVGPPDEPRMGDAPSDPSADNPLYARTPDELRDSEVIDVQGEKVGKIKSVVLGPDRDEALAVISSGGLLGIGATEIVVSVDDLRPADDGTLQASASKKDLEARGEYMPELYVELEPDKPISEFSAFEPVPGDDEPAATEPGDGDAGAQMPETPQAPQ